MGSRFKDDTPIDEMPLPKRRKSDLIVINMDM